MLRIRILVPLLAVCALMFGQFCFLSLAHAAPPDPVAVCVAPAPDDLARLALAADASPDSAAVADPLSGLASSPGLARWKERGKFDAPRGGDEDEEPETARADPPDRPPLPA
jgi:hypothetical protein